MLPSGTRTRVAEVRDADGAAEAVSAPLSVSHPPRGRGRPRPRRADRRRRGRAREPCASSRATVCWLGDRPARERRPLPAQARHPHRPGAAGRDRRPDRLRDARVARRRRAAAERHRARHAAPRRRDRRRRLRRNATPPAPSSSSTSRPTTPSPRGWSRSLRALAMTSPRRSRPARRRSRPTASPTTPSCSRRRSTACSRSRRGASSPPACSGCSDRGGGPRGRRRRRSSGSSPTCASVSDESVEPIIRACSLELQLANIAEERERVRRRRQYDATGEIQRESLAETAQILRDRNDRHRAADRAAADRARAHRAPDRGHAALGARPPVGRRGAAGPPRRPAHRPRRAAARCSTSCARC